MTDTEKIISIQKEFAKLLTNSEMLSTGAKFLIDQSTQQLEALIASREKEARVSELEGVIKLVDKIEASYRDTTLEEWKAFKHIRNGIRDSKIKSLKEEA